MYQVILSFLNNRNVILSSHVKQQNANVLFKTSFVDGVSKVDRIPLKKKVYPKDKKKKMEIENEKENQR